MRSVIFTIVGIILLFLMIIIIFSTAGFPNHQPAKAKKVRSQQQKRRFSPPPSSAAASFSTSEPLMPVERALRRHRVAIDPLNHWNLHFTITDIMSRNNNGPGYWTDPAYNAQTYCELALLHSRQCKRTESASECVDRIGAAKLELVLPIRCTNSSFFQKMVETERQKRNPAGDAVLSELPSENEWPSGGIIPDACRVPPPSKLLLVPINSGVAAAAVGPPFQGANYIPPSRRPFPNIHHKRRYARINCSFVYRLPMSIPEEMIVPEVPRDKLFDFSPVRLGRLGAQGYKFGRHDEAIVSEIYSRSYFAWTAKRGGWGSQRNLEILAAGSIPIFIAMDSCVHDAERFCLPGYPVSLVREAMFMPGVSHHFLPPEWDPSANAAIGPDLDADDQESKSSSKRNGRLIPAHLRPGGEKWFHKPVKYADGLLIYPRSDGKIDWHKFNETRYFEIADELLRYTKQHLTTKAIAAYFLKIMGVENPKYVFMTTNWWVYDQIGLLHGLAALGIKVLTPPGSNLHKLLWNSTEKHMAWVRQQFIWDGFRANAYSFGFRGYSKNILSCVEWPVPAAEQATHANCPALIRAGKVDLFAYSYSTLGAPQHSPYSDFYAKYYEKLVAPQNGIVPPSRVAFLDSNDQAAIFKGPRGLRDVCARGHVAFIRDAPDDSRRHAFPWVPLFEEKTP